MSSESTRVTDESPASALEESPESPDEILESPESPVQEEVLFFEDRRPGSISPSNIYTGGNKFQNEFGMDFIRISNNDDKEEYSERFDEVDGSQHVDKNTLIEATPQEDLLFIEDRNPQLTGQETQSPKYIINENFLKVKIHSGSKKRKFMNTCWNCGETSHSLRDCPDPKNYNEIARNRKEFQVSKPVMPVYKRYHLEESQKYAHVKPGELSEELREALGLEPLQLPSHIYMMRHLGYPPGWLKEAVIPHSGIAMYNNQNKEMSQEDKENDNVDKYDIQKIIHYPGFNVLPPPNTYDDSVYWQCPPQSRRQSIEVMLERIQDRVVSGYKRRKLNTSTDLECSSSISAESQDMEYEEMTENSIELPEDDCKFVPPLPDEEDLPPPPPVDVPDPNTSKSGDASLTELEERKKQLLAQLNDVSPLCSTPESKIGKVKSVDYGTPLLKSISPYGKLPSAEKFSKDICDVINFENLPDSTGKYEKMSGLIRKVRSRLSKLHNEDM